MSVCVVFLLKGILASRHKEKNVPGLVKFALDEFDVWRLEETVS